ncbi:Uu.00g033590.m01.CDS01 [Anthostomella pinea]|uniref:Uu.00g033590.m01.CDS01 n=1 Tax=Anthostomella pinea TaxID=933095 RepID=A0AAI8YD70_9PEZI|nr:Uu.00g033590.m01.CDS01 [Anthostomella pinea]
MAPYTPNASELPHLRRCVSLAAEALTAGDAPFGSVLVDGTGSARQEERNRITTANDQTRHPEFDLARWAAANMTAVERAGSTVYTSGEHCPMCAAAHAWVGLGRIVYVASAAQLVAWQSEWGVESSPVAPLSVGQVAPGVVVEGPVEELEAEIRGLHQRLVGV